ncbi:hypothetical protein BpHYR1_053543 [Brachionus plicatilis]|uniref:Uncharacterized protein n=1 Tax=Brachionus plicatilis TaxID=10195 RepID=A0A3M7PIH2_BRAPC|nr:hypothetical protein BpHYR1_053543 [Brachionus plicatilis]
MSNGPAKRLSNILIIYLRESTSDPYLLIPLAIKCLFKLKSQRFLLFLGKHPLNDGGLPQTIQQINKTMFSFSQLRHKISDN